MHQFLWKLVAKGETKTVALKVSGITEPVAGMSQEAPDFNSGSPRLDATTGNTYHYVMNNRIQATISSQIGANNQAGTFQSCWLGDIALLDDNATETLDWSEWVLSPTTNEPKRPWDREGEWLSLANIKVVGDTIHASGEAQIDSSIKTSVTYRALPNAPVVKLTLELENTGATDIKEYLQ